MAAGMGTSKSSGFDLNMVGIVVVVVDVVVFVLKDEFFFNFLANYIDLDCHFRILSYNYSKNLFYNYIAELAKNFPKV